MLKKLLIVGFAAVVATSGVNAKDVKTTDKDVTVKTDVNQEEMASIINAGQKYAQELKAQGMSDEQIFAELAVLVDNVENGNCQLIRTRGRNFVIGYLLATGVTLAACTAIYWFWLRLNKEEQAAVDAIRAAGKNAGKNAGENDHDDDSGEDN